MTMSKRDRDYIAWQTRSLWFYLFTHAVDLPFQPGFPLLNVLPQFRSQLAHLLQQFAIAGKNQSGQCGTDSRQRNQNTHHLVAQAFSSSPPA